MSEEGERAEGHRRTGPNPGPYPWPGPGPGYHDKDNAEPSRRPHAQQQRHHSAKQKNTLSVLYDHRPEYDRSSRSQDMSSSTGSRKLPSTSSAQQADTHGNDDHYLCYRPFEVKSKTSMSTSITGAHFRNKALSNKFRNLRSAKDREGRAKNQDGRHGLSHGKPADSAAARSSQTERIHCHASRLKRKYRRNPALACATSVHPIQPPDLRCKNVVHRESFRKTLAKEVAALPKPEIRSPVLCPNKRTATFKFVSAETSNPDIKISNIDEACAASFNYVEPKIDEVLDDQHSPSNCQPAILYHHETAESSLMVKHRGYCVPCPEVHFTTPEGEDLKMERYFPPEEDSVECSIHTCGMSSSMVSGVTLEHEMTPSEKLARVLPQRYTPQTAFSTDTVASFTDKEVIKVPNPKVDSSRIGTLLHRGSYISLTRDRSFDDANASLRIPIDGETTVHENGRNKRRDGDTSQDTYQTPSAPMIQDMMSGISGPHEISSPCASKDSAHWPVEILKATENLPDIIAEAVYDIPRIQALSSENLNIFDTAQIIPFAVDKALRSDKRIPDTFRNTDEGLPIPDKIVSDTKKRLDTVDNHVSANSTDDFPSEEGIVEVVESVSPLPFECKSSNTDPNRRSSEHFLRRSYRRNTVPKASTEMVHFQKESVLFESRMPTHSNEITTAELETIDIEENSISNHASLGNFAVDEKSFGSSQLNPVMEKVSNYSASAECQVSFTTNTESSEMYEIECKFSKEEFSNERVAMICSYKMECTPDENSEAASYDFQEDVSPKFSEDVRNGLGQCKTETISPMKSHSNSLDAYYASENELHHASKEVSLSMIPAKKIELLNKNFDPISSGRNAKNLCSISPNVDECEFNQGGFTNDLLLSLKQTAERGNKHDILEEIPDKVESFGEQNSADENSPSEYAVKMRAFVKDHLTAVFRRNSGVNSSQEKIVSPVQSKPPSAKTFISTNAQTGSQTHTERDNSMECFSHVCRMESPVLNVEKSGQEKTDDLGNISSPQEVTALRDFNHADTGSFKRTGTGSRTTNHACLQVESGLVETSPSGIGVGAVAPHASTMREERDSLKDQTRETISCAEILTESEDLVSMAEQLDMASFEVEVYEENITAKSVAELTEDNLLREIDKISEGDVEEGTLSWNNNTEKTNEQIGTECNNEYPAPFPLSSKTRKPAVSGYSEEQFSSGIRIETFDSNCQGSSSKNEAGEKDICSAVKELESRKSCSQIFTDSVQFPQVIFPDDETGTCKSFQSFDANRSLLKSGISIRGSGRVDWTTSAHEENNTGIKIEPSIVTLNDANEFIETRKQSDIEEGVVTADSPVISCSSMSSRNTHVLKKPSSSPSVGTFRFVSEMSYGGVCKTHLSCAQKTDDGQTRTKLMKKRFERKVEMRKRGHLFENAMDMYGRERKRKPLMERTAIAQETSRKETRRHSSSDSVNGVERTRFSRGSYNQEVENLGRRHLQPMVQRVPCSNEDNFEKFRSISDLYVTQSAPMASDSDTSDDDMGSPKQSVSPSLLNLGRFTPSKSSSWATFRHRQAIPNRTASNVPNFPSTQSRNSNRHSSRYLHSDEETNCSCHDSKKKLQRSSDFSLGSPRGLPSTSSGGIGRNMVTDSQEGRSGRDPIQECEYGASCLGSYGSEMSHAPRVVTFENVPSPRSSLRRYTLTPLGESIHTFDPSDSCEEARRRPRSPALLRSYSDDCFLHVSRSSIDATACCVDELSSAAQMSHEDRLTTSVSRNRYYEEVPIVSMSHESIQRRRRSGTAANPNADSFKTIWPRATGCVNNKTSSAAQTYSTTRSHSDLRVLTISKTTLLSLAEAGGHSTSRLSSPTPSDIPSPPPNPSPIRHCSQTKVDVAVGVNTLPNSGPRISESLIPLEKSRDSMTAIKIPVSTKGKHKSSAGSANIRSIPLAVFSSLTAGISNIDGSFDNSKDELDGTASIIVPSSIYPKNSVSSRGVATTGASGVLNPSSTYKRTHEADHVEQTDGETEQVEINRGRAGKRCAVSYPRTPPIVAKISGRETTRKNVYGSTDERHKTENLSDDSINTTDSLSNAPVSETEDIHKIHRPVVIGGHYRFNSAGQRIYKYSDLMGDISSAVPSRGTTTHLSGPTNRLSQSSMLGSHARSVGTRILDLSGSRIGMISPSDLIGPHGCHKERESYAQKPRPKLIKRPADASCRSSTLSKTSNTNQSRSYEDKPGEDNKRALPPAALDQNEENTDSNQVTNRLSNAGVIADFPASNYGASPISDYRSSNVRFTDALLNSRADGTHQQSIYGSSTEPSSWSYAEQPNFSTPSTAGRLYPGYSQECLYGSNQSSHMQMSQMVPPFAATCASYPEFFQEGQSGPNQSSRVQMGQSPPSSGARVVQAKVNLPSSHIGQNVCVRMKFRDAIPFPRTSTGQEPYTTQPLSPYQSHNYTSPTMLQCAPISEDPDLQSCESDAAFETQRQQDSRESPEYTNQKCEESSESAAKRREQKGRSSAKSDPKQKTLGLNKSVHNTGSKTKWGLANKHGKRVSRTVSKSSQTSTISLDETDNPPRIENNEGCPRDPCIIPWDSTFEDDSCIAEEVESTDAVPEHRPESGRGPRSQGANAYSVETETFDFNSEAQTRSVTRSDDISEGRFDMPGRSYPSGQTGRTRSEPQSSSTEKDDRSSATKQDPPKEDENNESEGSRTEEEKTTQLNPCGKDEELCKDVKYPPPGRRNSLYTYRVGYFPPPRAPRHPLSATACRVKRPVDPTPSVPKFQSKFHYYIRHQFYKNKKPHQTFGVAELPPPLPNDFKRKQSQTKGHTCLVTERDVEFPFILARPEAKPKRRSETIYDEARDKAPFREEEGERDYIQANIQNVSQSVPVKRPPRFVDTSRGHTQLLEPSGLEPRYVFRKEAAEVPKYLTESEHSSKGVYPE